MRYDDNFDDFVILTIFASCGQKLSTTAVATSEAYPMRDTQPSSPSVCIVGGAKVTQATVTETDASSHGKGARILLIEEW